MPVTINGTTGITTPDLDSTADISTNSVVVGKGTGNVASNTVVGNGALTSNTTGQNMTVVGYLAGAANTSNNSGTFVGASAGAATTGANNTFLGVSSGESVTTGSSNTILGRNTGIKNGIDVRTAALNVILSDGSGNQRFAAVTGTGKQTFIFTPDTGGDTGLALVTSNTKGGTVNLLSKAQIFPKQVYYGAMSLLLIQCGASEGTAGAYFRSDIITVIERFGSYTCTVSATVSNDGLPVTNWAYSYDGSNFRVTQNWSSGGSTIGTYWNIVNITGTQAG